MFRFRNVLILLFSLVPTAALAATAEVEDAKSIARLYFAAFNRNPDIGGLNFWVNSYEVGRSMVSIAGGLYKSPEFTSKYGSLSDQQYVGQLYQNVLGRPGDQEGVDFWIGHLASGVSRARILAEFADSPESIARTADMYTDMRLMNCQWYFGPGEPISAKTGYLVGPVVSGVAYETPAHQGVTGPQGEFEYEECETVRFTIGDTLLGEVTGQAQVTPFDLAGTPVITGTQVSQNHGPLAITGWGGRYPIDSFQWHDDDRYAENLADDFFDTPDPFHTMVNIAVLLQSLDEDASPENGIVIPQGVIELFRGVSLDLQQESDIFLGYQESPWGPGEFPTLRYLLQQAKQKQLFAVSRGLVKPAVALHQLYKALGLDTRTYATCPGGFQSNGWDVDCQYDASGNLTWLHLDSFGGGVTTNYEYDANGNMTRAEENFTGRRAITSWEYDADGNLVRSVSNDDDDDPISGRVESWQYDSNGNVVRYEEDGDNNRTADHFETWQYDASGRPTWWERHDVNDSASWANKSWQYGAKGKLARYEDSFYIEGNGHKSIQIWEYNVDGKLTRYYQENADTKEGIRYVKIETRQHDNKGNFTQRSYRDEGEGQESLQRTAYYQFDVKGKLLRVSRDYFGNEKPEKVESWQYDENGKVVRYECNFYCSYIARNDSYNVSKLAETWQYAASGKPIRAERRDGAGMGLDTKTWQYGANGKLSRYEEDENADGLPESVHSWEYDDSGNLARHEVNQGDGQLLIESWQNDVDGALTRFERNHDFVGAPSETQRWLYHATGWGHIFSGPNLWWLYY